jgi:hypothetical protein
MKAIRRLAAGLGVALFATTLAMVGAGPAQAAVTEPTDIQFCQLTIGDVTALDLQENGGDEIFLRIDDERFPASTLKTVKFDAPGKVQPPSAFETPSKIFSGTTRVELREKDLVVSSEIDHNTFGCATLDKTAVPFVGADAIYLVEVTVQVL